MLVGAIADRVGNERDRLDGRVQGELGFRRLCPAVLVVPNVAAVATIAAEAHAALIHANEVQ
ncbi:hypothetical protein BDS110ZK4_76290 [Bradyrhizobium diazoefficiens]|uniref:Uncharacterized protein n=1 Tax=Bradyrhizobium diazoefficiens TaxID=1355477 RepID=A0A809X918_9BRAD|nr:hypothetical protein XF1B_64750 [Bradyrhizobium diazoefficiens]BCE50054.1 hypothetical protein XF4B_64030 [Bradyrhizobium diazoefficiens]BCE93562.1 hypothetical protein XF10B_63600 [Bradyrhizobium diazoefficiens]BCF28498.1 hypothetical protein XF14B_64500 [Bradyrhizobium diazoefficiens]